VESYMAVTCTMTARAYWLTEQTKPISCPCHLH